jgi:flavodoxin
MDCLVIWYTRDGTTKKVGEHLAKLLGAETEEILDTKERKGIINWVICGKDAMTKSLTEIVSKKNPQKFKLVVIGTPVWAGRMAPAIRTYIENNKGTFSKVCIFCTQGGKNPGKTLTEIEEILQMACLKENFQTKDVKNDNFLGKLEDFANKIKTF